MTEDIEVLKDLVETLDNGKKGFADAADKLDGDGHPELAQQFRSYSEQRAQLSAELRDLASARGETIDTGGTVPGAMHRGWLAVKDAIHGSSPEGVLDAAEQGEDHAVSEFKSALDKDLSPDVAATVSRQYEEVRATHDAVRSLRDRAS